MIDDLPNSRLAVYIFLEMIALGFALEAVAAFARGDSVLKWVGLLVMGIVFMVLGVKSSRLLKGIQGYLNSRVIWMFLFVAGCLFSLYFVQRLFGLHMSEYRRFHDTTGYLAVSIIGVIVFCGLWWLAGVAAKTPVGSAEQEPQAPALVSANQTPSLVFVFGAPLGDNDSATWIMMLKHYGPAPAYNCDINFYDDDRKNIEHEWLVKHPNSPFPPPGLAGESQKRIYLPEANSGGATSNFTWNPVNPNSQHYTVSISCREGVFEEKWEITRVDGVLRSRITLVHGPQWIKNNPSLEPVIFRYQDPEFVTTALATEMPKSTTANVVHPGWKPSHRFEVPAAIIDSNGKVQVLSGVKAPDGSTVTDFGSWNILTKHYGDNPSDKKGN
jgi:hypothetical protein